ncbi:MAG: Holliday junction branch migration protein RuvA [Candidatus Andersenbacteria bacterium]|nr:Holliday junction branch migration protein RuvA [Candidatus Andersenbacteria bacterium]
MSINYLAVFAQESVGGVTFSFFSLRLKGMIAKLTGKVWEVEEKSLVLDVGGVGYRVAVSGALLKNMKAGEELVLEIHHHVSSENEALYGFRDKEGLRYFNLLLTVPSVGPRTAMNILDIAPPRTLAQAVAGSDVKLLTRVSGVGKKTAERILVELKGKIGAEKIVTGVRGDVQDETMSALLNLGFTTSQARAVVQKLPKQVKTVEEAVREALKTKS